MGQSTLVAFYLVDLWTGVMEEHEDATDFGNAKVAGFFLVSVLLVPFFGGGVRSGGQEYTDFLYSQRWQESQGSTRFRMACSMIMDLLANEIFKLLLFFTVPLLLASSASFMDFVKDAFAMTFIVQLDDCEPEDGAGVDEDDAFRRDKEGHVDIFHRDAGLWMPERRRGTSTSGGWDGVGTGNLDGVWDSYTKGYRTWGPEFPVPPLSLSYDYSWDGTGPVTFDQARSLSADKASLKLNLRSDASD
ncbi:unnamed protein product [Polarella glacialis]|uniref:Uncharacterized protein n=1 Tax=Polarella glacialis TaxID=89957 RepID=A0A813HKU4_POLGL|nr:unnamed protein product [Polarella glacialis]